MEECRGGALVVGCWGSATASPLVGGWAPSSSRGGLRGSAWRSSRASRDGGWGPPGALRGEVGGLSGGCPPVGEQGASGPWTGVEEGGVLDGELDE